MITALDELLRLIPPPPGHGGRLDWSATEDALGRSLPPDYKALVDAYGPVTFSGMFHLLQPNTSRGTDLLGLSRVFCDDLGYRLADDKARFPADRYPGINFVPDEVVQWGRSTTGREHIWHTGDADPAKWPTVLTDRYETHWAVYPGTVTELILQWITGQLTDPQFAEWDRDDYLEGETPDCEFWAPDSKGKLRIAQTVVIEELADTIRPGARPIDG